MNSTITITLPSGLDPAEVVKKVATMRKNKQRHIAKQKGEAIVVDDKLSDMDFLVQAITKEIIDEYKEVVSVEAQIVARKKAVAEVDAKISGK